MQHYSEKGYFLTDLIDFVELSNVDVPLAVLGIFDNVVLVTYVYIFVQLQTNTNLIICQQIPVLNQCQPNKFYQTPTNTNLN